MKRTKTHQTIISKARPFNIPETEMVTPAKILMKGNPNNISFITMEKQVIATVSGKYNFCSDMDAVDVVRNFSKISELNMIEYRQSTNISRTKNTYTFLSPDKFTIMGEDHYYGIIVKNTYGGLGNRQYFLIIFRSICENGAIMGKKTLETHTYRHSNSVNKDKATIDMSLLLNQKTNYIQAMKRLENTDVVFEPINDPEKYYDAKYSLVVDGIDFLKKSNFTTKFLNESFAIYDQIYKKELGENGYSLFNALTHTATHMIKKENTKVDYMEKVGELFLY